MASKNKKESTRSDHEVKSDQKLQAVILTNYDSFSKSFRPISFESPNILKPLMNIPVIEYIIEFLVQNNVEEIFIFCMRHADKLKGYIENSRWKKTNIKIECVSSSTCFSAGDALRELDSLGVVRSDPFLLMSSDSICNFKLEDALNFHKEKRKDDPNMIMTSILKRTKSHVKPVSDDLVVAYDTATSQIVIFENDLKSSTCKLPTEILVEHPHIQFTTGLLDCHIDVCSPEVLVQFSDNFDYQDIRKDFIKNEVVNFELGMHIYENEYAAQINEPRTYNAVTKDIAARWTYPLVSDAQLLHFCNSNYKHVKRGVYFDDSVKVMRSSEIIDSVIGKNSTVSNRSRIQGCTVGKDCHIASHVKIENSHIWDSVVVEDGVTISDAIICSNVTIKKGAIIPKGCIISFGVVIGEGVHIPEFSRMYIPSGGSGDVSSSSAAVSGNNKCNEGIEWNCDIAGSDDDDDDDDMDDDDRDDAASHGHNKSFASKSGAFIRGQSIGCNQDVILKLCRWERALNVEDVNCDENENNRDCNPENDMTDYDAKFQNMFSDNIADMVASGYKENHPPENVAMEIKSFKFSQNKTFVECLRGIMPSLLHVCEHESYGKSKNGFISFFKTFFSKSNWGFCLLRPFIQSIDDEICVIECIEKEATRAPTTGNENVLYPSFRFIIQIVYDSELVSDEATLKWIYLREQLCRFTDDSNKEILKLFQEESVQQFVQWVKQIDEDDEEEDDEDYE